MSSSSSYSSSSYSSSSWSSSSSSYSSSSSSSSSPPPSSSSSSSSSCPCSYSEPSPSSSSGPSDCCNDSASCNTSPEPIQYHTGQVVMDVPDIALTDGAFQYTHKRSTPKLEHCVYCGKPRDPGNAWKAGTGAALAQYSTFQRVEFSGNDSVHFSLLPNASGVYTTLHGYQETMKKDTVTKTLQVTRANLSVWSFNDDSSKTIPIGAPTSVVAADGNVTEYVYDNLKRVSKVQAYHNSLPSRILGAAEYTYDANSRIASILLKKWNGAALQSVERAVYTYHTGSDTFGNAGDVRTVATEIASGNNWVTGKTYYYRYYKPGDPKGRAGMLKMVFFPEDFEFFAATYGASSCFNVADSTALSFSTKYYEYDSKDRVVLEKVNRNSKTITFAYTEYPDNTNHNAVHRKTVETGAFGEQNIVFTNFKGDVLLKEQKPPQGVNETSAIHYFVGVSKICG